MPSLPASRAVQAAHAAGRTLCGCFDVLCRFTYIVGIQSIRIFRRISKRFSAYLRPVGYFLRHLYSITIGAYLYRAIEKITSFHTGARNIGKRVNRARRKDIFSGLSVFFRSLRKSAAAHRGILVTALHIAVPTACILVLISTVFYWKGKNFSLVLSNEGKTIGTISNEKVYEEATELVNQRMIHGTAQDDSVIKFLPSFRLAFGNLDLKTSGTVCNLLIQQSNGIIEEASGLYVDGELLGSVKSSADLRYMLQNRLNAAKGDDKDAAARFVKNIEVVSGLYPTASIITTDAMRELINGTSNSGTTYTVQQGDTLVSIAAANNMSVDSLKQLNGNLGDSIQPGDLLQIQLAIPTLEVELIKTVSYEAAIPYTTVTQKDDSQYSDYTKVLQDGSEGKESCKDKVHYVNGQETARESISKTILVPPVDRIVLTGTQKRPVNEKGVASGKFMWPVPSQHLITSPFAYRWGTFHKGIDISGSGAYGSTIVAADGGVVTLAGWNDGYGKCVIISHGNGMTTLYGHCSALLVSTGQAVSKGQAIGRIGETGDATGPHLHFEVVAGGRNVNPQNYVS